MLRYINCVVYLRCTLHLQQSSNYCYHIIAYIDLISFVDNPHQAIPRHFIPDLYSSIRIQESIPTRFPKNEPKWIESNYWVKESEVNWNWPLLRWIELKWVDEVGFGPMNRIGNELENLGDESEKNLAWRKHQEVSRIEPFWESSFLSDSHWHIIW